MSRPLKCRRVEFMPKMTFFKLAEVPISELEVCYFKCLNCSYQW